MRSKILFTTAFMIHLIVFSQDTIRINLNDMTRTIEQTLNRGNYKLIVKGKFDIDQYYINYKMTDSTITIDPIEITEVKKDSSIKPKIFESNLHQFQKEFKIQMRNRSKFEVNLNVIKKTNDSIIQKHKIVYNSKTNKKWITTFGVSSVFQKSDTYQTIKHTDSTYQIIKDGNNQKLLVIPLMQFSYINLDVDNGFAFTGGIGFDTENISVFAGGSYFIGHNIFLTAGLGLHKQKKLNNLYSKNQIVNDPIEQTELNKEFYRINPFVSLTYRLTKNVFN